MYTMSPFCCRPYCLGHTIIFTFIVCYFNSNNKYIYLTLMQIFDIFLQEWRTQWDKHCMANVALHCMCGWFYGWLKPVAGNVEIVCTMPDGGKETATCFVFHSSMVILKFLRSKCSHICLCPIIRAFLEHYLEVVSCTSPITEVVIEGLYVFENWRLLNWMV